MEAMMPQPSNGTPTFVRLVGQASTAELRIESLAGKRHIVVPVVGLVGGVVVTGLTSKGPEYIPPDVLAAAPSGWDGRPILCAHPSDGKSSANTPASWDSSCFGQIFNTEFSDNRLRMEAWLDPSKAELIGDDALEILAKAEKGEMFEVSTGAYVWLTEESGVSPSGDQYEYVWQACVPDHLAVGLQSQGGRGACSIEDGCGGMRVNAKAKENRMDILSIMAKLADPAAYARDLGDSLGESTNQLMTKLSKALRATVPGFLYIADVFPDANTAIYVAMPKDAYEWYRCKYDDSGEEATTSLHKQVEPTTTYKTLAANGEAETEPEVEIVANANGDCKCKAAASHSASGSCSCHDHASKGDTMATVSELAGQLIACAAAKFVEADRPKLEALSADQLSGMLKAFSEPTPQPEPTPAPEPSPEPQPGDKKAVEVKQPTEAEALAALPADVRTMVSRWQAKEKAHRDALVTKLAAAQKVFTTAQLGAKPTDELEALCALAGVDTPPDFSGAAGVVSANAEVDERPLPPDPWKVGALAAQLGHKVSTVQ
jgi:hypothetical protein